MQRFCSRLGKLDRFQVLLGKLAFRGQDSHGEPIFIQKQVDILLGVDLVLLSVKHTIDRAVLLVGDSDFLPAIRAAKDEGVLVHLYHGGPKNPPHRDLWDAADDRTLMDQEFINSIEPIAKCLLSLRAKGVIASFSVVWVGGTSFSPRR